MKKGVSRNDISKEGVVNEIHKQARRNFNRRHVTIKGLNDLYQGDLVEMIPYADENDGYKYLLTMIDAFTKRAWAYPLKSKKGKEVAETLDKLFGGLDATPKFLQADDGGEFFNRNVKPVLKKFGIELYSSKSPLKATIIERFNRTIKTWMWKQFSLQGSYRWIDILDGLISRYNNKVHRTTGFAPLKVNKKNARIVLKRLRSLPLPPRTKKKFKVGQSVRISKYKHAFEKGYTPNWTTEVFIVDEVCKTRPTTYKLRDFEGEPVEGGFYQEELLKTKHKDTFLVEEVLQTRGSESLVKWLGFKDKYNSWIPNSQLGE